MTRKRFIKIIQAVGIPKRQAEILAKIARKYYWDRRGEVSPYYRCIVRLMFHPHDPTYSEHLLNLSGSGIPREIAKLRQKKTDQPRRNES